MCIMNGFTPWNGVKNSAPGSTRSECRLSIHITIESTSGTEFLTVSEANPFIMRIYFAHVSRLIVLHETLFSEGVLQYLAAANGNNGIPVHISP